MLAFDRAHVGNLAAPGGVEGGLGELDEVAAVRLRHRPDGRVLTLCLIAREMRLKAAAGGERARRVAPARAVARAVGRPRRPAARALLLHQLVEVTLDAKPLAGEQLARHLVGEPVRVVQAEHLRCRHGRATGVVGLLDMQPQRGQPLGEGAPEALLLGREPLVDRLRLLDQFGVDTAHQLAHALAIAREEARGELQAAPVLDRPAHHAAQHVAAVLVGGHDAVGDEKGHRARVVGEDPQ